MFNPLPNDKILNMTKLKAFADGKSNAAKIANSHCDRVENTVRKGENDANSIFIFSLIISLKPSSLGMSKVRIAW